MGKKQGAWCPPFSLVQSIVNRGLRSSESPMQDQTVQPTLQPTLGGVCCCCPLALGLALLEVTCYVDTVDTVAPRTGIVACWAGCSLACCGVTQGMSVTLKPDHPGPPIPSPPSRELWVASGNLMKPLQFSIGKMKLVTPNSESYWEDQMSHHV